MQNNVASPNRPISHLVVTWLLLIPLFYFASQGTLWFQNPGGNRALGGFGSLENAPRTTASSVTLLLIFVIVFVLLFFRIESILRVCHDSSVFVALAALAIVSCLWSQFPIKSLEYSIFLFVNTLLAFYLYRRFSHYQQMKLLYLLGWICLALSIVLALFFPQYGISNLGGLGVWQGIYSNRNGCSMMTILFLSVAFFTPAIALFAKVIRITYIGLSVLLVLMTQSATGKISLICLLAYVTAVWVIKMISSKDRLIILLLGATIGLTFIAAGISYSRKIMYFIGKDPTLTGRTEIWKGVIISIVKHPVLGYGYKAFWKGLQGESANNMLVSGFLVGHAHNGFMEIWLELGAVGLGLFLYSMVRTFRDTLVCLRAGKMPYLFWCACLVFLVLVSSLDEVEEIVSPNSLPWILYILACVGLSEGARRIRLGQDHG